jgi:flagellar hook-associated protein 3 FlgL
MRVSTGMIFDAGASGINRQTASLLHVQQQVASGRRILTPSEDPVAAARALEVKQSSDVVTQFIQNQGYATSTLGLEESQVTSAIDVLARVRELALQGGNPSVGATARKNIATELRSRFDQLLGSANASDGTGQHMFAGFSGAATPFGGTVDAILAGGEMGYQGDDGQRTMQISSSRFIEVSDPGSDVFMRIKNGNGVFATDYSAGNTGTGIVSSGSVTDPAAWNASSIKAVTINFSVTAGVTTYDLVDTATGDSLLTGGPGAAPPGNQRAYLSGQPIALTFQPGEAYFDLGATTVISGSPADGDNFSVAPSTSQSIFATIANLIGALETPTGSAAADAKYSNELKFALVNLDQGSNNLVRVRAEIGSRMSEIESVASLNQSLDLQYQQNLSDLQDLDYAKAITELTRKQANLEAAQKSFSNISQLSLFNYL